MRVSGAKGRVRGAMEGQKSEVEDEGGAVGRMRVERWVGGRGRAIW